MQVQTKFCGSSEKSPLEIALMAGASARLAVGQVLGAVRGDGRETHLG
jgi:hypothetical protein